MSKSMFEVQQTIKNLKQQINDVLHLASLNNQSIMCLGYNKNISQKSLKTLQNNQNQKNSNQNSKIIQSLQNFLLKTHLEMQDKFKRISEIFQKRSENHLNYLIVKQIQGEEQSVRRDRLNEYEQKIYDQRRLISDKQVFLQSLFRPKKQRPQSMTSDDFQQLRAKQRIQEETVKNKTLEEETKKLASFKSKMIDVDFRNTNKKKSDSIIINEQIQLSKKLNKEDLQKTKSSSLQTVTLSVFNNPVVDRPQKIVEQTQLNTILNQNTQQGSTKKIQNEEKYLHPQMKQSDNQGYNSQKSIEKQNDNIFYSIQIQKLIQTYEKSSVSQQTKEKFHNIKFLLRKIELKKEQNNNKNKQLLELKKENIHMLVHLKKIKECYVTNTTTKNKREQNCDQ